MKKNRVAVIGMGGKFAGAENPQELWQLMMRGESCSTAMEVRFPEFWRYYHSENKAEGKFYNQKAFFLKKNIDLFDADFFHISYKEAKRMDYQQRMLLEVSYEALQDAGIEIGGTDAGIFIGAFMQDFLTNTMQEKNYDSLSSQHATGSSIGMLASRLSYFYDVHGPSMAVDTACSSSLTALYLATESIRNGTCNVALCGGVNIMTEPGNFITLSKGGFLSKKSCSAAFGDGADGYARGEGVGVLVLKNWEEARRDKDRILCEIAQVQVSHDGNKKGITYPNGQAQTKLLQKVYENGAISVEDIGYVEAHGTGTQIGDRVEAEALSRVFGRRKEPLYIGSLKTNIGHTEAAAGIASVIKGILMLQHGIIPPSLYCKKRNPNIPFEEYHIVPAEKEEVLKAASDGRSYVGINGFGFGGANAHVVIGSVEKKSGDGAGEEEPVCKEAGHILYLSANSIHSLKRLTENYKYAIQCGKLKEYSLEEICKSAAVRRSHDLPCRLAVTAKDIPQLAKQLTKFEREESDPDQMYKCSSKKYKKLLAVFSGMGIQTKDMGKDLYRHFPVFRECFHRCSQAYEANSGQSLEKVIKEVQAPEDFYRVGFLQSYNLAYQISLFALLRDMGMQFDGCAGHSAGELAAFYCSGMLSLEETFRVAWHRGKCQELMQGKGKMLALKADRKKAIALCEQWKGEISLAVENGPNDVVLSGDYEVLMKIKEELEGCFLKGSVAYHSIQMEDIREVFCEKIGQSATEKPGLWLYSTTYGRRMEEADYDGSYWWKNVRNTVEFSKTLKEVKRDGYDAFTEIGTTPVLSHYIAEQFHERDFTCITIQSKRREGTESEQLYRGVMQAYVNHAPMDFQGEGMCNRMLPLPAYPWDYKLLPVETPIGKNRESKTYLGKRLEMPQEIWENRLNLISHSWLAGHKIQKECYLPAAFYIAMLSEAGVNYIEEMEVKQPIVLDRGKDLILNLIRHQNGEMETSAAGRSRDDWRTVMHCRKGEKREWQRNKLTGEQMEEMRNGKHISGRAVYPILKEKSLCYEGVFNSIEEAWIEEGRACCKITSGCCEQRGGAYAGILDVMLQAAALAGGREPEAFQDKMMLPVSFEKIKLYESVELKAGNLFAEARIKEATPEEWTADISLYDEGGERLMEFTQVHFKSKKTAEEKDREVYKQIWEEIELPVIGSDSKQKKTEVYHAGDDWQNDIERIIRLVKERKQDAPPLLVVTENAIRVSGQDTLQNYRQAALWGVVRCLRLERTDVQIYLLDADAPETVEQLQLSGGLPEAEYELAVRRGKLYGSRICREREKADNAVEKQQADTAVITGASGGVAFSYALYLAGKGIKHMVLLSRHQTPRLDILSEVLDYYGVECMYFRADVTEPEQMRKCWEGLQHKKYGRKIVYHLAGYSRDCPAEDISPELLEAHMKPKLEGALNLSELVRETGDEMILAGSVTALLGNPGQGCYAAANMALQSFGEYAGYKVKGFGALNTGMAVQNENIKNALERQGIELMECRDAIGRVEDSTESVCYGAELDWNKLMKIRNIEADHKFQHMMQFRQQEEAFWKEYDAADTAGREQILIEEMQKIYARILGMSEEEIAPDRNTDTMGIDSLSSAFISGRIQQRLDQSVMPDMISGPFTIRNMAMRMALEIERKKEE